jgi:hypothetical protein
MHRDEQHLLDMGLLLLPFIGNLTIYTHLLGLVADLVDLQERVEGFDKTKHFATFEDGLVANRSRSAVFYVILDSFVDPVATLVE